MRFVWQIVSLNKFVHFIEMKMKAIKALSSKRRKKFITSFSKSCKYVLKIQKCGLYPLGRTLHNKFYSPAMFAHLWLQVKVVL